MYRQDVTALETSSCGECHQASLKNQQQGKLRIYLASSILFSFFFYKNYGIEL